MKKKFGIIAKYFLKVLTGIVIVSIFFALYGFFQITVLNKSYASYFGHGLFIVESGSMAPTIDVDDMVIVKKTNKINKNDIITYNLNKNFITHRVVEVQKNKIITKGDSNNFEDKTIPRKTVIGKVVHVVPKFGVWKKIILSPVVIVVIFFAVLLFGLGVSYEDKNKSKKKKANVNKKGIDKILEMLSLKLQSVLSKYKTLNNTNANVNKEQPKKEKEENINKKENEISTTNTDITGEIKWIDNDDQDGIRPEKVTVKLIKNDEVVESKEIKKEDNWKYSFKNIKQSEGNNEIKYMVDEVMVSGYRKEISDHNITNTHDPKKINVAGEIKWLDNDEKNRPDSITIKLIKNDEVLETKKVTKNNKWKYTFINLYKYEKGKEIEYKIKEDIVPNYEQNVSGYDITNSYVSKKDNKS